MTVATCMAMPPSAFSLEFNCNSGLVCLRDCGRVGLAIGELLCSVATFFPFRTACILTNFTTIYLTVASSSLTEPGRTPRTPEVILLKSQLQASETRTQGWFKHQHTFSQLMIIGCCDHTVNLLCPTRCTHASCAKNLISERERKSVKKAMEMLRILSTIKCWG